MIQIGSFFHDLHFQAYSPSLYAPSLSALPALLTHLHLHLHLHLQANITHGFYYSLTNNFYLNVNSHNAHAAKALPGQVDVSQAEYEAIALAQVKGCF